LVSGPALALANGNHHDHHAFIFDAVYQAIAESTRDTTCRPVSEQFRKSQEDLSMKNLFAAIGLAVVLKKSYELYCEYSEPKREKEARQPPSA
jgi:hypothetical protein